MSLVESLYSIKISAHVAKNNILFKRWNSGVSFLVYAFAKARFMLAPALRMKSKAAPSPSGFVISLASMPERIECLKLCLDSLYRQKLQPDALILCVDNSYLEFFNRELEGYKESGLIIKGTDSLGPHNKYLTTFQDYRDSIVITVDDDVYYPAYLTEGLIAASQENEDSIICARCHKLCFDSEGKILPYDDWDSASDCACPSIDFLPTGVGGVLYRPRLFPSITYDAEKIRENCLYADDLWLKAMEVIAEIPSRRPSFRNIEWAAIRRGKGGSSLEDINVGKRRNDDYIQNLEKSFGLSERIRDALDLRKNA